MGMDVETVTVDCSEPDRLAAWWARVLGGTVTPVLRGEFVRYSPIPTATPSA